MKPLIIILLILGNSFSTYCQDQSLTTDKEWNDLIEYLSKEDFKEANKLVKPMLDKLANAKVENDEPSILRYIHIVCVSALMNSQEYTKDEALQIAKEYEGEFLIMPGREIIMNNCNFNCIKMDEEKENTIFVTSTNSSGTEIFGFERYKIENGITTEELEKNEGKIATVGGKLENIEVEGFALPRFRITVKEAMIIIE